MTTRFSIIAAIAATTCLSMSALGTEELYTEQILVTAVRTPVNAAILPLAWSVVDAQTIDFTNHVHINEIMQQVSGAWISRGNGQESLSSLRSPVLTGAGGCGTIYVASDGISLRAPGFCNVNQLFDANAEQAGRIEVIKGPATALYGSNAMHGVINILSAIPTELDDNTLAVEAGPYDYYRAKYRYSHTAGQHSFGIRANASTDGGYKDDSGYDQQKLTVRHDFSAGQWDVTTVLNASNLKQETAGFIKGDEAYKDGGLKDSNPNPEAYRDARAVMLSTRIDYAVNDSNTITITPYLRDNEMAFLQHFLPWQSTEENGHSSLGFRAFLNTTGESFAWVNGIDFDYTDGWLKEFQDDDFSPNQPAGTHYNYQVDAGVTALYSQFSGDLNSSWNYSLGARLEHTRYDYNNKESNGSVCASTASNCRFYRPADSEDRFTDWSLNAGASYQFSQQQFTYVRVAQGFRAPQATELYRLQAGQSETNLDSEEITSVELGVRGVLFQSLQYDIATYNMNKDEVIFQDADRQNVSGAKTRHAGVDLSLDYQIADHWNVRLDATYAQHKYDSRARLLGSSDNIKGNYIDTAPKVFGSAAINWDMSATTGVPGRAELEWVYMDSYYLEPDNKYEYEGHSLINLTVSSHISQRLSASVRVTNLLDEDYAERADFGFGDYRYFVGQPRAAYLELSYQFAAL